jgi:hypothetical protein
LKPLSSEKGADQAKDPSRCSGAAPAPEKKPAERTCLLEAGSWKTFQKRERKRNKP